MNDQDYERSQQRATALDAAALTFSRTGAPDAQAVIDRAQALYEWLTTGREAEIVRPKFAAPPRSMDS